MKTAQKSTADKFHEEKSDSINAAADKKRDSRKMCIRDRCITASDAEQAGMYLIL